MESLEQSMSVETLRRLELGELTIRIRGLMGLEAVNEDALDTVSTAQPATADFVTEPMMGLFQLMADSRDESETSMQECFRLFLIRWKSLKRDLKPGRLAWIMREYLDRLGCTSGTRRPSESIFIDLT